MSRYSEQSSPLPPFIEELGLPAMDPALSPVEARQQVAEALGAALDTAFTEHAS